MNSKTRMVITWGIACLVVGLLGLVVYDREAQQLEESVRQREVSRVELFVQVFGEDFHERTADLHVLTESEALQEFLADGRPESLARLTREMARLSRHFEDYYKIRFLDTFGQERVRIDASGQIAPSSVLENKSDRPYFREAIGLPSGAVYVSAFDLDVEKGSVALPIKPILRFAAPVFDPAGRSRGILVISLLGSHILDQFRRLTPLYHARLRLLNPGGYWLVGATPDDEWGFMLPERAGRTLAKTAPAFWDEIKANGEGQSRALDGLFTWKRLSPAGFVDGPGHPARVGDEYLVVGSEIDARTWNEQFFHLRRLFTELGIVMLVLTTGSVWLLSMRRQAGERLEVAHQLNATIIRAANVAVISTSTDGVITGFNPTAERLLGWSAGDLIGRQTLTRFHDPGELEARASELAAEFGGVVAPTFDALVSKARRDGVEEREWTYVRKDGRRVPVSVSVSVLRDARGAVAGYLGVASDMTARRQVETVLREAHADAKDSARLKSQFLANMSHEIRTPMNGVIGMIELLLDSELDEDQRLLARTVQSSADALLKIINDILDFSKIEAGRLTIEAMPFDLIEPVERSLLLVAERAQAKGVEIAFLVEEDVPSRLVGDAGRIHQVLLNLVGNAVKFTARGEVVVRVSKVSEHDRRVLLRFAVRDTGLGLSAEQQAKLFQAFVQADGSTARQFGGTGLGLAICKQLVGLMNGAIGIESELGQGSTFWFTIELPTVEAAPTIVRHMEGLAGRRALIVDDNATNREILRRQLSGWRMESATASNGDEALRALSASAAAGCPLHFVLLDMQMPGMNGLQTAARVRCDPALAGVKMIILTSMGQTLTRRELEEAGIEACLSKPVRKSQLHDTLIALIGGSSALTTTAVPRPTPATSALAASPGLRILVAEDNAVNQMVVLRQLRHLGSEADVVDDGAKVVEAACSRPYDLILMDCQMPEVDGFEATRRIRQWEAGRRTSGEAVEPLHIVAMTANAMAGDRETCLAAGMDDYISKPVLAGDLAAALARSPASLALAART